MIAWEKHKRDKLKEILEKYSTALPEVVRPKNVQARNFGFSEFLQDFCQNSTIHGLKYMGDRKRHWGERLWWLVAFLLSIFFCARIISKVWQKWDRNPVIVTFAESSTPIWQIPFPAVTICLQTKTQSNLFNFTDTYRMIRSVDSGFLEQNFTQDQ